MMHVLTEEESKKFDINLDKEISNWWEDLSLLEKRNIYEYHKPMLKYIKCSHEFKKINYYSSTIESCNKCGYTRTLQESRNEKIDQIDG